MATIYLHIGLPKTGTTAIQNFLCSNEAVLANYGICFPVFEHKYDGVSIRRNAHFLVACYDDNNASEQPEHYTPTAEYTSAMDQITSLAQNYDKILLSDEIIWRTGLIHPDFWPTVKADFNRRGLTLKVIVYLRRQDLFVQSRYKQRIKKGESFTFYEFLETLDKDNYPLDFYEALELISGHIGRENLILRTYEKSRFQGAEHSLISDFLTIFDLTKAEGFFEEEKLFNPSLEGAYLELRRLLNILPDNSRLAPIVNSSLREIYEANPGMDSPEKKSLFRPGDQRAFLDRFTQSNSRIAREYLNREDGILFYEPLKELPHETVSADELLRETIVIYGRAFQKLENKNKELQKRIDAADKSIKKLSAPCLVKRAVKRLLGRS